MDVARYCAVEVPIILLDPHATVQEHAGVEPPERIDSRSLVSYRPGETDEHRVVYAGLDPWRMSSDDRYEFVFGCDVERGPGERRAPFHGTGEVVDDSEDAD